MTSNEHICTVFVQTLTGLEDLRISYTLDTTVDCVRDDILSKLPESVAKSVVITTRGGLNIRDYTTVRQLCRGITHAPYFVNVMLRVPLCGGKGGFGHMLKQGHGISKKRKKKKSKNGDEKALYNTLDGRKVRTVKRIHQLEKQLEMMDELERRKLMDKKESLQKILDTDLTKNVKFDDTEFLDDLDKQLDDISGAIDLTDSGSEDDVSTDDGSSSDSEDEKKHQQTETNKTKKLNSFFSD